MLIKRYGGVFNFLCAAVPVKFFGSLLAGGVWVISYPVASLAPGLEGLNSWTKGDPSSPSPLTNADKLG